MHQYSSDLPAFEKLYKPTRLQGDSGQRQHYELRCIERWLVLHSFSIKNNISKLFYGDNDNVLFGNISSTVLRRRWIHHFDNGTENDELNRQTGGTCEAMVSVEGHMSEHDFLGTGLLINNSYGFKTYIKTPFSVSGHSSFWTQAALTDLTDFLINLYNIPNYHDAVALTGISLHPRRNGDRVVDMTLLYLWWVAHHNISDVSELTTHNMIDIVC